MIKTAFTEDPQGACINTSIKRAEDVPGCWGEIKLDRISAAATIFQTAIRSLQVKNTTILPSELQISWSQLPMLASLAQEVQREFSVIIARELQTLQQSAFPYKETHFCKSKEYQISPGHKARPERPFFIKIDPKAQVAVISFNEKKSDDSLLGKTEHKFVRSGVELQVSLQMGEIHRTTVVSSKAISYPRSPEEFDLELLPCNEMHIKVLQKVKDHGLLGRFSTPAVAREYVSKGQRKRVFIQERYQSDLQKVIQNANTLQADKWSPPVKLNLETRLSLLEDLFEAIDSLATLGITHRDVKPANVLLKYDLGSLHAYLHDFGLTQDNNPLGLPQYYHYWDSFSLFRYVWWHNDQHRAHLWRGCLPWEAKQRGARGIFGALVSSNQQNDTIGPRHIP
jgi:serine/threonine protein kinase